MEELVRSPDLSHSRRLGPFRKRFGRSTTVKSYSGHHESKLLQQDSGGLEYGITAKESTVQQQCSKSNMSTTRPTASLRKGSPATVREQVTLSRDSVLRLEVDND
ncbi:hypothetical protein KC338_g240 [Hortaea werneckii]|nr:hypothetical protein KC338_g240 [Hortaea werneckii]